MERTEEKTEEIVNLAETEKKEVANANAEELEIDLDPVELSDNISDNIQVIKINRSIVCYLLNLCLNITYIPYSYPTY